jgi:hypothetical protein
MTNIQQKLDRVITKVHEKLARDEFLIPVKTEAGILIGNVLIVSRDALKDIYMDGELIYQSISLNKVAIKIANLLALSQTRNQGRVRELYQADLRFGLALQDYQIFKEKYNAARLNQDIFKMDLYMARMCYSKDASEYHKKTATHLAK